MERIKLMENKQTPEMSTLWNESTLNYKKYFFSITNFLITSQM